MELSIGLAVIAGLVSFISPCVLPLVPAYIGYMGGRMTNTVAASVGGGNITESAPLSKRFNTALHGVFFVAGFTFVFVTIGLLSTAFIQQIGGENINTVTGIIGRVGGIIIIFFGLHFMGILPNMFARLRKREGLLDSVGFSLLVALVGSLLIIWGFNGTLTPWMPGRFQSNTWLLVLTGGLEAAFILWLVINGAITQPGKFWNRNLGRIEIALYSDTRKQLQPSGHQSYAGSAIMGVVFSAGWTPCIGLVKLRLSKDLAPSKEGVQNGRRNHDRSRHGRIQTKLAAFVRAGSRGGFVAPDGGAGVAIGSAGPGGLGTGRL